ncbi:hypothetical protein K435DRAFT_665916 [Dendrothele bispora CBS 962.96]|uniref:Ubiquitin-like protease family profile domain-containing protein n=1 Tax=Dendrothele bispora (strain CBS 962.96) TaxID=1314807 RepID=A0A4S8M0U1_DENBC|nr:hypothetical protein K435DRAFT_665916 [Dendrothele bispora CBS 962.96]
MDRRERYPLWIVKYWLQAEKIRTAQDDWKKAVEAIQQRRTIESLVDGKSLPLVEQAYDALKYLHWSGDIKGFSINVEMRYLTHLFTTHWLSSEHIDLFTELLRESLIHSKQGSSVELPGETAMFVPKIIQAYDKQDTYHDLSNKDFRWIQRIGQNLVSGKKVRLGMLANVRESHWVALVVDAEMHTIFHGDPLHDTIDDQLKLALQWWTYQHFGTEFIVRDMPVARQLDSHSCGILAWRALEAFLLDEVCCLDEGEKAEDARLKAFLRVVERHDRQVSIPL